MFEEVLFLGDYEIFVYWLGSLEIYFFLGLVKLVEDLASKLGLSFKLNLFPC